MGRGNFEGWKGHPIVKYRDTLQSHVKTAEPVEMPFGLWARKGPRNHVLDGRPAVLRALPWQPILGLKLLSTGFV